MSLRVRDVMARDVQVVPVSADLASLAPLLVNGIHSTVPVIDAQRRIVGTLNPESLKELESRPGAGSGRISELMCPIFHAVAPDTPLAEAAARMIVERVPRLVVVDSDFHVVGMLSALDLLRGLEGVNSILERLNGDA